MDPAARDRSPDLSTPVHVVEGAARGGTALPPRRDGHAPPPGYRRARRYRA